MKNIYLGIKNVFKTCLKNPLVNLLLLTGFASTTQAQCNINLTVSGLNANGVLCSGTSATITSDAISNYSWSPGNSISAALIVSPTVTTTYTLNATSSANCPTTAVVTVSVVLTPTLMPTASPSMICEGKSSTLTALAGAAGYTWTGGSATGNTNTYVVTPPAGINSFTLTRTLSGCTGTVSRIVIVNALPTVFAIASSTLVCATKPVTLTVAGGTTWTWTSPGNPPTVPSFTFAGATPQVFPPVSTIYSVAASDGTCVNTTTVEVQTNPNPTINATATPSNICSGGSVTINATGSNNWTITSSSDPTFTGTTLPFTQSLTQATSYAITGVNAFNCYTTYNQIVVVAPIPTITAVVVGTKTLVCSGGSTSIGATAGNTQQLAIHSYTWSTGALTPTTIVNPVNNVTGPVIYTVNGTNTITTCKSEATVAVNVFVPVVGVTGSTATCIGKGLSLQGFGGNTNGGYKWYTVSGSSTPTSTNPVLNIPALNAPAQYTLVTTTSSTTAQNCIVTNTIDVNIYFNPTITAVAQRTPICAGESVEITGGGGVSYVWSNGDVGQIATVSPTINTNYTVTGQDANSCENTMTVQVKVSACVGIGEVSLVNIGLNVYPNPSNGEFVIKSAANLKLNLVNDLGQLIRTVELSGANDYKVSVSDLARGIYFLSGEKDNQQIRQKIIVTK